MCAPIETVENANCGAVFDDHEARLSKKKLNTASSEAKWDLGERGKHQSKTKEAVIVCQQCRSIVDEARAAC